MTQGIETPSEEFCRGEKRATKAGKEIPAALAQFDFLPSSAFVRLPVICGLLSQAPATVWRNVARGTMPAPRRFGNRCSAWSVAEIREFLAQRQS